MPLRLSNDRVEIEILPLGATLHSFRVRQPDGSWKLYRDIFNSNVPAPQSSDNAAP